MGYQVYMYNQPESQECIECLHSLSIILKDGVEGSIICELNFNKTKEDNCKLFTKNLRKED